jgi:hypothetical protein
MSYYNFTNTHRIFKIDLYMFTGILKKMGAHEKVKIEMVVSNPWVWNPMVFGKMKLKRGLII